LEEARVVIPGPAPSLVAKLEPEAILDLRRKSKLFEVVRKSSRKDTGAFLRDFISAFEKYWLEIIEHLEKTFPEECRVKTRLHIFVGDNLPTFAGLYDRWRLPLLTLLYRTHLNHFLEEPDASAASIVLAERTVAGLKKLEVLLAYRRTDEIDALRHAMPPKQWATNSWARVNYDDLA
jgi:hypothetical protein